MMYLLVLSPDFWISNTPRYFSFPLCRHGWLWVRSVFVELSWICCLTSQLTIFQSHMWWHIDVQADWRRSWTYGRAPNAIDISQSVFVSSISALHILNWQVRNFIDTLDIVNAKDDSVEKLKFFLNMEKLELRKNLIMERNLNEKHRLAGKSKFKKYLPIWLVSFEIVNRL